MGLKQDKRSFSTSFFFWEVLKTSLALRMTYMGIVNVVVATFPFFKMEKLLTLTDSSHLKLITKIQSYLLVVYLFMLSVIRPDFEVVEEGLFSNYVMIGGNYHHSFKFSFFKQICQNYRG